MPVVAVGPLVVIALALLAILIVYGAALLGKLLANLISRIPLGIGDLFSGPVQSMANAVVHGTEAAAAALMAPVNMLFHAVVTSWDTLWTAASNLSGDLSGAVQRIYTHSLHWIENHAIATAVAMVRPYALSLFHQAETLTETAVRQLDTDINAVEGRITTAEHEIARDFQSVGDRIDTVTHELVNDISAAEAAAVAAATALVNGVRLDLTRAIQLAETQAAQGLAATTTALGGLISQSVTDLTDLAKGADAELAAAIDAAASQVAVAAWPQITDLVDGIKAKVAGLDRPIEGIIDGIPAAVPTTLEGVLATTMALAEAATTYVRECGIDLCQNLGGLSNFMGGLANDLEEGALFALIALMIAEPEAGAEAVRVTLGPPAAAVAGLAREVFA